MVKYVDELTPAEKQAVSTLKQQFSKELEENPETNTAWFLMRFYRARSGNLKEVSKMLKKFYEWRKARNIMRIARLGEDLLKPLYDNHERGFYNNDKTGRPVLIEQFAKTDIPKFLAPGTDHIREDYMISLYEKTIFTVLPAASAAAGHRVDNIVVIYDMAGVNFGKFFDSKFKAFSKLMISIVQDFYPELLGRLIIINAPFAFRMIWAFVKVFVDKKTVNKVEIYGDNAIDKIACHVEKHNLPDFLGGTCKEPLKSNSGPWNEDLKSSYSRKSFFLSDRTPEYKYYYASDEISKK